MRGNTKLEIFTRDSDTALYEEKGSKHQDQLGVSHRLNLSSAQNADSLTGSDFRLYSKQTHVSFVTAALYRNERNSSCKESQVNGI